jgi:hypothetical protein
MKVRLTQYEIYMGSCVGSARMLASLKRGQTNKVQNKDFGWHSDIEGACAEIVVAKALNVYWGGSVNTFKLPDVAGVQVRHTQLDDGCLIVRSDDSDSEIFVLVTGSHPDYEIRGWCSGLDAKKKGTERNPGGNFPAWFVEQSQLEDISLMAAA